MKTTQHLRRERISFNLVRAQLLLLGLALLTGPTARGNSVNDSVHNLSVSGTGSIKSTTETNSCIFCHTVHKAMGDSPLWNHTLSSVNNYVVYSSPRLDALGITVPQPNGSSRLCLSCHDGTVALGGISSSVTPVALHQGGAALTTLPTGATNLGTDLSGDHPVSVDYDGAAQVDPNLKPRAALSPAVPLEQLNGVNFVQCTSCHDPHDDRFGNFLVMDKANSALCLSCHQPDQWNSSAHAISSTPVPLAASANGPPSGSLPMSTVGCASCHLTHKAPGKQHLLQSQIPEQNCLVCHNGVTLQKNLAADFQKNSIHPITVNSQAHSPTEDPVNPKSRHVVCADCHDPHAVSVMPAVAPNSSGALANLTGMADGGGITKPLQREYELCFRCHADSIARGPATVSRQFPETNTRLQFSGSNQSFHPVVQIGRNQGNVPSLITPWTVNSLMYCSDCHNSDSGPKAGGNGANGPHGSIFAPILERYLAVADYQPESPATYALCYKCHDQNRVLSNVSFRYHYSHVVEDKAACTTCHDSHGVAHAPHLINFNTLYVTNSSLGIINYTPAGPTGGNCTLTCHGHDHKNAGY